MAVPEDGANLRGRSTLPGELADVVDDLVGGDLEPGWRSAGVGDGGSGDTLATAVHATHFGGCVGGCRLKDGRCGDVLS